MAEDPSRSPQQFVVGPAKHLYEAQDFMIQDPTAGAAGVFPVCLDYEPRHGLKKGFPERMSVPCALVSPHGLPVMSQQLNVDQAIRSAIGLPHFIDGSPWVACDLRVRILGYSKLGRLRETIARRALGWRYALLRVHRSDLADLEKPCCRIPDHVFPTLGCDSGDRVMIEAVSTEDSTWNVSQPKLSRLVIDGYGISKDRQDQLREEYPQFCHNFTYYDNRKAPDIPAIYLNTELRSLLGVELYSVVRVRRDVWHLFLRHLRDIGVSLFVSVFALALLVPGGIHSWWVSVVVVVLALSITLTVTMVTMESRVNSRPNKLRARLW
jgi:hypothetical protein